MAQTDPNAHSHYLIANGVALLAISQHPKFGNASNATRGLPRYAGALIGTGAVLFSGSIFMLLLDRARYVFHFFFFLTCTYCCNPEFARY